MSSEWTAIVTGAARGIGLAIARRLTHEGLRVAIADLDGETARRQADALQTDGADALAVPVDVTDPASVEAMVRTVLERWGRLDVLVNNAGIAGRNAPIQDLSLDEWQQVIAVDLNGVFLCCRAAVEARAKTGDGGRIVNVAARPALEWRSGAGMAAYTASKAAVAALTVALA